ncbi:MAG TPA: TIGR00730 family Rossman fold protein, partial [Acidimicrobiia bacterium]|nr:TIGR00730 family Rossman fold protein [Acidimicrobiia bacterium]
MAVDRHLLEHDHGDVDAHVEMIAAEFRKGFEAVARIPPPAITVFGSARTDVDEPEYARARACGRALAEAGFAVVTG